MIVTPAQLLLAIAEHESLEETCQALGLTREAARKLLRGAALQLQQEKLPLAEPPKAPAAGRTVMVYSDGAARGNPGPAGAGAVLTDAGGAVIARLGRFLGHQTNNVAEYEGLLLGLEHARELGYRQVEVRADSQLLIRQLKGEYAVRNA
ncbi:MAG TPA: ribonuclease HI family protein, partial [Myxococcales bacterium]|nr:ribonuclease HI family protein [Myxococcales bacterium]